MFTPIAREVAEELNVVDLLFLHNPPCLQPLKAW